MSDDSRYTPGGIPMAPPPPPPSKPRVREVATRDMGELADGSRLHVFEKRQVMGPALSFEVERHWKEVGHWEWEPGTGCFVALKGFDFEKQAPAAADAYDLLFRGPSESYGPPEHKAFEHPDGTPCAEVVSHHRLIPEKRRLVFVQGRKALLVCSLIVQRGAPHMVEAEFEALVRSVSMTG
ncbi:MAG: hypothetical protein H6737_04100 [Alphaproteobacteria bacterium]|nr:hypothetical protein [Alphaproteobacteria bacterium]